jgi:hypothetical protein
VEEEVEDRIGIQEEKQALDKAEGLELVDQQLEAEDLEFLDKETVEETQVEKLAEVLVQITQQVAEVEQDLLVKLQQALHRLVEMEDLDYNHQLLEQHITMLQVEVAEHIRQELVLVVEALAVAVEEAQTKGLQVLAEEVH